MDDIFLGKVFLYVWFFVSLVLKLCNVIDWSWWWISSPLGAYLAITGVWFFVVLALRLIYGDIYILVVEED